MKDVLEKRNRIQGIPFSTRKAVIGLRKSFCGVKYLFIPQIIF